MTATRLSKLKKTLEVLNVAAALRLTHIRNDVAVERSPDALDGIQFTNDRQVAQLTSNWDSHLLNMVQSALSRFDTGKYGICVSCEQPIPMKRLAAVPWTPYCIACQEAADVRDEHEAGCAT
jgi:DnaK suppressor protein